jgi:hypothetical protein
VGSTIESTTRCRPWTDRPIRGGATHGPGKRSTWNRPSNPPPGRPTTHSDPPGPRVRQTPRNAEASTAAALGDRALEVLSGGTPLLVAPLHRIERNSGLAGLCCGDRTPSCVCSVHRRRRRATRSAALTWKRVELRHPRRGSFEGLFHVEHPRAARPRSVPERPTVQRRNPSRSRRCQEADGRAHGFHDVNASNLHARSAPDSRRTRHAHRQCASALRTAP